MRFFSLFFGCARVCLCMCLSFFAFLFTKFCRNGKKMFGKVKKKVVKREAKNLVLFVSDLHLIGIHYSRAQKFVGKERSERTEREKKLSRKWFLFVFIGIDLSSHYYSFLWQIKIERDRMGNEFNCLFFVVSLQFFSHLPSFVFDSHSFIVSSSGEHIPKVKMSFFALNAGARKKNPNRGNALRQRKEEKDKRIKLILRHQMKLFLFSLQFSIHSFVYSCLNVPVWF